MLELLRQSKAVKWMKVKRQWWLVNKSMHEPKEKKATFVPLWIKKGTALFIALWSHRFCFTSFINFCFKKKRKDDEGKCESFEFKDAEVKKGCAIHWKLRLHCLQWLNFSCLLQGTPGGHLEEWGYPYLYLYHHTVSPIIHD